MENIYLRMEHSGKATVWEKSSGNPAPRYFRSPTIYSIDEYKAQAFDSDWHNETGDETREEADLLSEAFLRKIGWEGERFVCDLLRTNGDNEYRFGNDKEKLELETYDYMAGYDASFFKIYTPDEAIKLAYRADTEFDRTFDALKEFFQDNGYEVSQKSMIEQIINNFKPRDTDVVSYDFQLENDSRWQHLKELQSMLEDLGYDKDAERLQEFMDGYEINDRLLTRLCEKTDAHPVHKGHKANQPHKPIEETLAELEAMEAQGLVTRELK